MFHLKGEQHDQLPKRESNSWPIGIGEGLNSGHHYWHHKLLPLYKWATCGIKKETIYSRNARRRDPKVYAGIHSYECIGARAKRENKKSVQWPHWH